VNSVGRHLGRTLGKSARGIGPLGSSARNAIVALFLVLVGAVGHAEEIVYPFTYPDRSSLHADGWDFLAVTPTGNVRNTEQITGAVVSYDQATHPGILRVPADFGDLFGGDNSSRNTLFRDLPPDWTSIRLKLAGFAPTENYQQAGLLAYQDDDNYVQVTRIFENGNRITFAREVNRAASLVSRPPVSATTDIFLRLDRYPPDERISGFYSLDGVTWVGLGTVSQALSNPRLAIFVGTSYRHFPVADLASVTISTEPPSGSFNTHPSQVVFNGTAGRNTPIRQTINVAGDPGTWEAEVSAPWLQAWPGTSGSIPGSFDLSVDSSQLSTGVYSANVTLTSDLEGTSVQNVEVKLIVNPDVAARVAVWRYGHRGALSVSVDDGFNSCAAQLEQHGLRGTYVSNGVIPPVHYPGLYSAGMELGAHLVTHACAIQDEDTLRYQQIEPNIAGLAAYTDMPAEEIVTLAWPCGVTDVNSQVVASDYFLSARGYYWNSLESTTPSNFMDLKSFDDYYWEWRLGNLSGPLPDLKDIVDLAEQEGKWANFVFHNSCSDDGAIQYATTRDVWVAPIGEVVKYILQRDRLVISEFQEDEIGVAFRFHRLEVPASDWRAFETAFTSQDKVTLTVEVDPSRDVSAVYVDGESHPYDLRVSPNGSLLLIDALATSHPQRVDVLWGAQYQYSLNAVAEPATGGTVSPAGESWHDAGASVSLSATAASGYEFS
jgi:regulation of enolase protein 1 (concanavalin A-like superfamily)